MKHIASVAVLVAAAACGPSATSTAGRRPPALARTADTAPVGVAPDREIALHPEFDALAVADGQPLLHQPYWLVEDTRQLSRGEPVRVAAEVRLEASPRDAATLSPAAVAWAGQHQIIIDIDECHDQLTTPGIEHLRCASFGPVTAAQILTQTSLRTLILDDAARIGDEFFERLGELSQLRTLDLQDVPMTARTLRALAALPLEHLGLYQVGALDTAALELIAGMTTLRSLFINWTEVAPGAHAALARLPNLAALDLTSASVTDADVAALAGIPTLRHFGIGGSSVTDDSCTQLARARNLTSLVIFWSSISDACLPSLAQLPLRRLQLGRNDLTDVGVGELARITTLEDLDLWRTGVGTAGVTALAGLPALRALGLAETDVDDAALATLPSTLVQLDVLKTDVTAAGLAALTRLRGLEVLRAGVDPTDAELAVLRPLTSLRYVHLLDLRDGRGPGGLSDAGLATLAAWPRLRVFLGTMASVSTAGIAALDGLTDLMKVVLLGQDGADIASCGEPPAELEAAFERAHPHAYVGVSCPYPR